MNELPEPLVPAEVDLRGMPWMPVETERLMNSDLWAISTPEEFKTAFRMWMKAWQQVPAASLPDDDRILAELSGTGRRWARIRPMALRGFVKCSDGRLYHPVIAPKAIEAWKHRSAQRDRANKRWHPPGIATAGAAADATAMQGTVKGKGQKEIKDDVELTLDGGAHKAPDKTRMLRSQAVEVLSFLNDKASRNYEAVSANVDLIVARLREGSTPADCKAVIAKKCREWLTDEKMNLYLRPATLFARTNFAQYKGELAPAGVT